MANNEKVLSIVIPCYNEENSILDLVKKVLESPVPNKEIIVVDDLIERKRQGLGRPTLIYVKNFSGA